MVERLRDRPEFFDGRRIVDQWAVERGGHWCVCYVESTRDFCIAEYHEAKRPGVEALLILYQRDGGDLRPAHPGYRAAVLRDVRELVRDMGPDLACKWARYVDSLSPEAQQDLAAINWHAAVVVRFRELI